jgi:hypothetical protein
MPVDDLLDVIRRGDGDPVTGSRDETDVTDKTRADWRDRAAALTT